MNFGCKELIIGMTKANIAVSLLMMSFLAKLLQTLTRLEKIIRNPTTDFVLGLKMTSHESSEHRFGKICRQSQMAVQSFEKRNIEIREKLFCKSFGSPLYLHRLESGITQTVFLTM